MWGREKKRSDMITLVLYEEGGMGSIRGWGGTRERSYERNEKDNSMKREDGAGWMRQARRERSRE